ncbi:hypothetical protein K437DRAFT_257126 [Tilletiaria anomala UBC 951]|uniref:DUF4219 domain-containing protein n=1 Tax=Tilletiaria anomala (strain ATCC 24038 / CBS 436.72 / UBC 951) TaxID=1037660 RepID=A0A066VVF1_TILAU|nr:uncharacterized protein K437DRAFT_257126 [Tilletiaria anomala UBC 951]KDN44258.1 hypothetical protein K437DRAFT_257126 [Tilletiaria anomala UBC 951]
MSANATSPWATASIEKLYGGNRDLWAFKVRILITTGQWGYVTGMVSKPLIEDGAVTEYGCRQEEALATLTLGIDDKIAGSIRMVKAAKELWTTLEAEYQPKKGVALFLPKRDFWTVKKFILTVEANSQYKKCFLTEHPESLRGSAVRC